MNDKITEHLKKIEEHSKVLLEIPANEQNLSNIKSVVAYAIFDIGRCLEAIVSEFERRKGAVVAVEQTGPAIVPPAATEYLPDQKP